MAQATAESDQLLLDVHKNVTMSRGAEPELSIDFKSIEDLELYDEKGSKVRVGDIYANQKTILILVRHFLCYICKVRRFGCLRLKVVYSVYFKSYYIKYI